MRRSFEGLGGSDAPSLDYGRDEMTGTDIAKMMGGKCISACLTEGAEGFDPQCERLA